jgi:hypothetical protein
LILGVFDFYTGFGWFLGGIALLILTGSARVGVPQIHSLSQLLQNPNLVSYGRIAQLPASDDFLLQPQSKVEQVLRCAGLVEGAGDGV